MSEEMKKQNGELNEAALAGVSGGYSEEWLRSTKRMFCDRCGAKLSRSCTGSFEQLVEYLNQVGVGNCSSWSQCPFVARS